MERGGHVLAPALERDVYRIAGASGTILYPGGPRGEIKYAGALIPIWRHETLAESQAAIRNLAAWLAVGRRELICDWEPTKYYLAEVADEMTWAYDDWIEGALAVSFVLQPWAYNVGLSSATGAITGGAGSVALTVSTGAPAPIRAVVTNAGSGTLTGITIALGGKSVVLAGLSLAPSASVTVDMDPPCGATLSGGASAMPNATRFDYLTAADGLNNVAITIAGASAASVAISARGRY